MTQFPFLEKKRAFVESVPRPRDALGRLSLGSLHHRRAKHFSFETALGNTQAKSAASPS